MKFSTKNTRNIALSCSVKFLFATLNRVCVAHCIRVTDRRTEDRQTERPSAIACSNSVKAALREPNRRTVASAQPDDPSGWADGPPLCNAEVDETARRVGSCRVAFRRAGTRYRSRLDVPSHQPDPKWPDPTGPYVGPCIALEQSGRPVNNTVTLLLTSPSSVQSADGWHWRADLTSYILPVVSQQQQYFSESRGLLG